MNFVLFGKIVSFAFLAWSILGIAVCVYEEKNYSNLQRSFDAINGIKRTFNYGRFVLGFLISSALLISLYF